MNKRPLTLINPTNGKKITVLSNCVLVPANPPVKPTLVSNVSPITIPKAYTSHIQSEIARKITQKSNSPEIQQAEIEKRCVLESNTESAKKRMCETGK